MTAPFALGNLTDDDLRAWHQVAVGQGWDEVVYDVREELQARAADATADHGIER